MQSSSDFNNVTAVHFKNNVARELAEQKVRWTYRLEGILHSGRLPCPPFWPAGSPCSLPPESPPPCWSHVSDRELNFTKVSQFLDLQPVFPITNRLGLDCHTAAKGGHHENPHHR